MSALLMKSSYCYKPAQQDTRLSGCVKCTKSEFTCRKNANYFHWVLWETNLTKTRKLNVRWCSIKDSTVQGGRLSGFSFNPDNPLTAGHWRLHCIQFKKINLFVLFLCWSTNHWIKLIDQAQLRSKKVYISLSVLSP